MRSTLFVLATALAASAQQPVRVLDLNREPQARLSSEPTPGRKQRTFARTSNQWTYFTAATEDSGRELYRTLGIANTTRMVADVWPGRSSSRIDWLTAVGTRAFFSANDGRHGQELWVSDGTPGGTRMVKDIDTRQSSQPRWLAKLGNRVVFAASELSTGDELWISDGTKAGTTLLKDIAPGNRSSAPNNLTPFGSGRVAFLVPDALWVTDGTAKGTFKIHDASPYGIPRAFGNELLFVAPSTSTGYSLWITDGTAKGTRSVLPTGAMSTFLRQAATVGNRMFFAATGNNTGEELWVTDGTAIGTKLVSDIFQGPRSSAIADLTVLGSRVCFSAEGSGGEGRELWISDGTTSGTRIVRDIAPGFDSSSPDDLQVLRDRLLFRARTRNEGVELWTSDGTKQGTRIVRDIYAGTLSASPSYLTLVLNNRVLFRATDARTGTELWTTDGTTAGTRLLNDLSPRKGATGDATPSHIVAFRGRIYFMATDGKAPNRQLWSTDGTATGTRLIANLRGVASTVPMVALDRALVFAGWDPVIGQELWASDGTASGTRMIKDTSPGFLNGINSEIVRVGDVAYFGAAGGLWVTDGSANGTRRVSNKAAPYAIAPLGRGRRFVMAAGRNTLWVSNGTDAGTKQYTDVRYTGTGPRGLVAWKDRVWFHGSTPSAVAELFVTDGTASGTKLVKDLIPGPAGGSPMFLQPWNDRMFFTAASRAAGFEVWQTDGTTAGTRLALDLYPGPTSSGPRFYTRIGQRRMYFQAEHPTLGNELWISDGTKAGTRPLPEIRPGLGGSFATNYSIGPYAELDGKLFFSADDGTTGRELWMVDNGATAQPVGRSCGATDPELRIDDPVLGKSISIRGLRSPIGKVGVILLGTPARTQIPISASCRLQVELRQPVFTSSFATTSANWTVPVTIPNDASLTGLTLAWQAAYAPAIELTNACWTTFGK